MLPHQFLNSFLNRLPGLGGTDLELTVNAIIQSNVNHSTLFGCGLLCHARLQIGLCLLI